MRETFEAETPLWITLPGIGKVPAQVTERAGRLHNCRFVVSLQDAPGDGVATAVVELRANNAIEADPQAAVRPWPRPIRVLVAILLTLSLWALIFAWLRP